MNISTPKVQRKPLIEKTLPATVRKTPPRIKPPNNVKSNVVSPPKRKPLYSVKVNRLTADRLGSASSKGRNYTPTPSKISSLSNGKGILSPSRYGLNSASSNTSSKIRAPAPKQSKIEPSVTTKRGTLNRYGISTTITPSTPSRNSSVTIKSPPKIRSSVITKPKPKESKLELLKRDFTKKLEENSKCAVAMTTLLDYVVNKNNGLAAPKLLQQKQQLEKIAVESGNVIDHLQAIVNKETFKNNELHSKLNEVMNTLENERKINVSKIAEVNETHSLELEDLRLENEANEEEWTIKLDIKIEEIEHLKSTFNQRVKEELQVHEEKYHNANAECQSLREVLSMREKESHKLKQEMAETQSQMTDIKTLEDIKIQQMQRIEDLQSQLLGKTDENRKLQTENIKIRHSLDDEKNTSLSQERKIEELTYRLNSSTPLPSSPFNPVFTPSPTGVDANGVFETPRRGKSNPQNYGGGSFLNGDNDVVHSANLASG